VSLTRSGVYQPPDVCGDGSRLEFGALGLPVFSAFELDILGGLGGHRASVQSDRSFGCRLTQLRVSALEVQIDG
jgi:hypothetical protein